MPVIDFVGTIVLTAVIVVNVSAVISAMPMRGAGRLGLVLAVGVWIGLQAALGSAGVYAQPTPYIGIAVAFPVITAAAAWRWSPQFRATLLAVPATLLVGLNAARLLGIFFLILAADGRLGGPFPQSAGWGDIAVGALAIPLVTAMIRGSATRGTILAWNMLGAFDLLAAVSLGLLSAPGSPVQMIDAGPGSSAIGSLPWALIPTALVPFYLIAHGVIFMQLREKAGGRLQAA